MNDKLNIVLINKIGLLLIFIALFLGNACIKKNSYNWVSYDETYCSDGWTYSTNNETLKQNLVDYFKGKNITIYDSEIFVSKEAEPSTTCTNKTGRVIKCKIKNQNLSSMKGYGFSE